MTETNTHTDNQTEETSNEEKANLGRILVVDDERSARTALAALLSEEGYQVEQVRDGYKALGLLEKRPFDIVLTDLRMPLLSGIELIEKAKPLYPDAAFIVMTAYGSIEDAVQAMKTGAEEFLIKPLNFDAVQLVVERTLRRQRMCQELSQLRTSAKSNKRKRPTVFVGTSGPIKEILQTASQVADTRAAVIICGEPGTGKRLLAKYIHDQSNRNSQPFVTIHCGTMPEDILEVELFGKGNKDDKDLKIGILERAKNGFLFLDEIATLSEPLQLKLFNFLQNREFCRVGSDEVIKSDIRIVGSSLRPLEEFVRDQKFREDLYYRVAIVRIDMPPLCARRSDIPQLVKRFVHIYSKENQKTIKTITSECLEMLESHSWPGNVQELENVIERAVVLCDEDTLDVKHLPKNLGHLTSGTQLLGRGVVIPGSKLADIERCAIIQTYEATGGKTAETASILDVSQRKIQYKLRQYMVDMDKY